MKAGKELNTNVQSVIARLKEVTNTRTDIELSLALGISKRDIANWKQRDTVDFEVVVYFAIDNDINIKWLLTGEGTKSVVQLRTNEISGIEEINFGKGDANLFQSFFSEKLNLPSSASHFCFIHSDILVDFGIRKNDCLILAKATGIGYKELHSIPEESRVTLLPMVMGVELGDSYEIHIGAVAGVGRQGSESWSFFNNHCSINMSFDSFKESEKYEILASIHTKPLNDTSVLNLLDNVLSGKLRPISDEFTDIQRNIADTFSWVSDTIYYDKFGLSEAEVQKAVDFYKEIGKEDGIKAYEENQEYIPNRRLREDS